MKKIAIIGGGVIGMSVAAELAEQAQVTLFDPNPGGGASHGSSRIFRHGHDDSHLVALSRRASMLWSEWEKQAGRELIHRGGLITLGSAAQPRRDLLAEAEVTHRWRNVGKIHSIGLGFDSALWEPGAGVIWSEQVMSTLRDRLAQGDIEMVAEHVFEVNEKNGRGRVWARSGPRDFDRVLLLAGPGLFELLYDWSYHEAMIDLSQGLRLEFPVQPGTRPVESFVDRDAGLYGLPCTGFRRYAVGTSGDSLENLSATIISYVNRRLAHLDPKPENTSVCTAVEVEGQGDRWALHDQGPVMAFVGGNLFKWAPLLGEELAALALGRDPDPRFLQACLYR